MMELEKPLELLDRSGCLIQEGWARQQIWHYDRRLVAHPATLLKEWDRYLVVDKDGRWMVLACASRIGGHMVYSITYADIENKAVYSEKARTSASGSNLDDDINYSSNTMRSAFIRRGDTTNIMLSATSFSVPGPENGIDARFILSCIPQEQTFVSAAALNKSRKSFLLNEIKACVPVTGIFRCGGITNLIGNEDKAMAICDYGRGRFITKPMAKALFCGTVDNSHVGLCLVESSASAIIVDGLVHTLEDVRITGEDGGFRFESKDLKAYMAKTVTEGVSSSFQHFGKLKGSVRLEDGRVLNLDAMPGIVLQVLEK